MGGSVDKGGGSSSSGQSSSRSFLDPAGAQFQQGIRDTAQGAFNQLQPGFAQQAQQLGQGLSQQASDFTTSLLGTATGQNRAAQNLQQLGSQSNPFLDQQIQGLGGDFQRQLQQSLQGIGQGFAAANQFGGQRQGLAEGQAVGQSVQAFGTQAAGLRGQDLTRQAQANQALLGAQNQAGAIGQAGLGDQFNLGLAPFTSQLGFIGQLGGIGGPAQVLGESESISRSKSKDKGGFGLSLLG